MAYNHRRLAAITFVERKVRQQFVTSSNRLEDVFDIEKFNNAIATLSQQRSAQKVISPDLSLSLWFMQMFHLIAEYDTGNCQRQAIYAFACYLAIDFDEVDILTTRYHIVTTDLDDDIVRINDAHFFLRVGKLAPHIHEVHGHEFYPESEIFNGIHHTNRYLKSNIYEPSYAFTQEDILYIKSCLHRERFAHRLHNEFDEFSAAFGGDILRATFVGPLQRYSLTTREQCMAFQMCRVTEGLVMQQQHRHAEALAYFSEAMTVQANLFTQRSLEMCDILVRISYSLGQINCHEQIATFYTDMFITLCAAIKFKWPMSHQDYLLYAKVATYLGDLALHEGDIADAVNNYKHAAYAATFAKTRGHTPSGELLIYSLFGRDRSEKLEQILAQPKTLLPTLGMPV